MTPPGELRRAALNWLAVARQADVDDLTATVYLQALADVDDAVLRRACQQLANEPRADYAPALPTVGTIRERCELIARDERAQLAAADVPALPATVDDADPRTHYFCARCRDELSGWRMFWCPGIDAGSVPDADGTIPIDACTRYRPHAAHRFVVRCLCWQHNPIVVRRQAQHAAVRERRTRRKAS